MKLKKILFLFFEELIKFSRKEILTFSDEVILDTCKYLEEIEGIRFIIDKDTYYHSNTDCDEEEFIQLSW